MVIDDAWFARRKEMDEITEELEEAARAEGTECGETWAGITYLWRCQDGLSSSFTEALEQEIRDQHKWFKENFTWVQHDAMKCDNCGKGHPAYRELVWNENLWGDCGNKDV